MIHHLRQIEKSSPLKKRMRSGVQHVHLSGDPATILGPMFLRPALSRGLPFSQHH
jgi:hypothetical protein